MNKSRPIFITIGDLAVELPRNIAGAVERGPLRDHFAQKAHAECSRGIKGLAQKQRPERLVLSDQPRQLHEVDRRDQSDIDLRIAECRGVAGDDHVARDRNRHAAGPHRAVDRGNGRLAHAILGVVQREIQPLEEFLGFDPGLAPDDVEIEPGTEHLVQAADDD